MNVLKDAITLKVIFTDHIMPFNYNLGFPCGSACKESCNAGELGLISGLRRSTGEGKCYPLRYSSLENIQPMGLPRIGHD
jgi:hypothetical protein